MITSADFAVILPELVLVGGAILILLLDAFWSSFVKNLGVVTTASVIFVALIALFMADPDASLAFGVLSSDPLSAFIGFIVLLSAFLVTMLSWGYLEERKLQAGEYLVGILICSAGMILMSRSTNLMMIFVALEILSICLYMMIGYDRTNGDSAEAALKYFLLGAFASAIFIFGAVLIYGQTGTMSLDGPLPAYRYQLGLVGVLMLIVGLAFKISIAPFHLWTPDVYQGAPAPVAAFLSSASKAAAVAVLIRLFVPGPGIWPDHWNIIWPWLAVLTMFLGNIVALVQEDLKRILAYSSIAHVGYILVALSAGGGIGASAVLFYVLTYALATIGTFGVIAAMPGDENGRVDLHYVRGLSRSHPLLAAAMTLFVLSLAGVPPLIGFMGKLVAFRAALVADLYPLVIFAALNAAMAVYYYLRIIIRMYMEPRSEPLTFRVPQMIYPSLAVAGLGVILIGIFPGEALEWAARSARELLGM
jgi:NADH-quinone oxidoreductase subunit N